MVKRRGNNEGSIVKRKTCSACKKVTSSNNSEKLINCRLCGAELPKEGTWMAQATTGIDPKTGKAKRRTFYGKTRKEAIEKMQDVLHDLKGGVYIEPSTYTLEEWLDKWLFEYKKGKLKTHTFESYQTLIDVHIKPSLGGLLIAKIQANQIQEFYNQKLENGRNDGKGGLSTRMVRYLHAVIRQALQQAVKEGLIPRNMADATEPPTVKNKKMRPLTEEELLIFLGEAKEDRLFAAYVLAATTGLRRGELLGLCWDCVDLEKGIITVMRQLIPLKGRLELEETTKSKSSRRAVILSDDAIRELKAHKIIQEKNKRWNVGKEAYQDNNLVFAREDGTYLGPSEFTKRFQRHLKNAGLPKVRLHDLRHTHASLLLSRGIHPKVVQERLGHSSISMTLDLYSHLTKGMQEAAATSLNGLMDNKKIKTQNS